MSFKPSFMNTAIVPETMYTDGGSIPQIFWSIPGLSPWGFGPAYIIHDWIFLVHRCQRPAPPEVQAITFEQSAQILAEVGKSLVEAGLIKDNRLEEIVWAIRTKYARDIWDRPATADECAIPVVAARERNPTWFGSEPHSRGFCCSATTKKVAVPISRPPCAPSVRSGLCPGFRCAPSGYVLACDEIRLVQRIHTRCRPREGGDPSPPSS